jgi:hypothetical protein
MDKKFTPLDFVNLKLKHKSRAQNTRSHDINTGSMMIIILAVWAVIGGTSILIAKYSSTKSKAQPLQVNSKAQMSTKELLDKVEILFDLPKGEMPTIATVSDKTKLEKQSFFARAENGDKVIIYTKAKKAILYRPSINKLIEVAPLTLVPQQK